MKCDDCNAKLKNLTKVTLKFNIKNPETMEVYCENNYDGLSMADTVTFREALHCALDKTLNEMGGQIFVNRTKR